MLEGLLQPMHLIVLAVLFVGAFVVSRALWRIGAKLK
jgi:hypothetical protein